VITAKEARPSPATIKRHLAVLAGAVACALVFAASALAGPHAFAYGWYWYAGMDASSSYSASWYKVSFNKANSGYDTTVTMIDNVSYSWHGTARNSNLVTWSDAWFSSVVKKGYCKAHESNFYGSCYVYDP
jgi:hypothetical protein